MQLEDWFLKQNYSSEKQNLWTNKITDEQKNKTKLIFKTFIPLKYRGINVMGCGQFEGGTLNVPLSTINCFNRAVQNRWNVKNFAISGLSTLFRIPGISNWTVYQTKEGNSWEVIENHE